MSHVASRNQASIWSVAPLGKTTILADSRRRMAKRHAEERLDTWPTDFHTVRVGSWGQSVDFLLRVAFNKTCPGMNVDVVSTPKKTRCQLENKTKHDNWKKRTNKSTRVTWICVVSHGDSYYVLFLLDSLDPSTYILPGGGGSTPHCLDVHMGLPFELHTLATQDVWHGLLDRWTVVGQDVWCSTLQHQKARYGR